MKEIWQLWLGIWLGLPTMERKSSIRWDMPTKTKNEYGNMQKNMDMQKTRIGTQSGFLKRQKEMVLVEQEKKQKEIQYMQKAEQAYAQMQPYSIWYGKSRVAEEQMTTLQEKPKYQRPIQETVSHVIEPSGQKETVLFSTISKQAPKQQEQNIITQMGMLQQGKVFANKRNEKMLTPFLHTTTHQAMIEPIQQHEQPSAIWKQQGEDVVMLQKILRHYENQQNGVVGNQNVSIQIGHIKQQADVDDVMEALTKKLWEARSMTTKKAKGSVVHG